MKKIYNWAIIGAGPSGIACIGKLLDSGASPASIAWIDPEFKVGDFGTTWAFVESNSKVKSFRQFLYASESFQYKDCPVDFSFNHLENDETCLLQMVTEPLQWITNHFKNKVTTINSYAENLKHSHRLWEINLIDTTIYSKNVILAIGVVPKTIPYSIPSIPLQDALIGERLKKHININDHVAVFGSATSAILALKNLLEDTTVKQVINFYRSHIHYATSQGDWVLFKDKGLKGIAARWARNNIDDKLPDKLRRIYASDENIHKYLLQCTKAIYAIGFEQRTKPIVEDFEGVKYNPPCGIIAPGLFGIGIAFPEFSYNPLGMSEHHAAIFKTIDYLHRILPIWFNYPA